MRSRTSETVAFMCVSCVLGTVVLKSLVVNPKDPLGLDAPL